MADLSASFPRQKAHCLSGAQNSRNNVREGRETRRYEERGQKSGAEGSWGLRRGVSLPMVALLSCYCGCTPSPLISGTCGSQTCDVNRRRLCEPF